MAIPRPSLPTSRLALRGARQISPSSSLRTRAKGLFLGGCRRECACGWFHRRGSSISGSPSYIAFAGRPRGCWFSFFGWLLAIYVGPRRLRSVSPGWEKGGYRANSSTRPVSCIIDHSPVVWIERGRFLRESTLSPGSRCVQLRPNTIPRSLPSAPGSSTLPVSREPVTCILR